MSDQNELIKDLTHELVKLARENGTLLERTAEKDAPGVPSTKNHPAAVALNQLISGAAAGLGGIPGREYCLLCVTRGDGVATNITYGMLLDVLEEALA
jgi:hypothetical protein